MKRLRITLPLSLGVLAGWLALTIGVGWITSGGGTQSLGDAASVGIGPGWLLAALFAAAFALASDDRRAAGLCAPRPWKSVGLVWLPLLYAALMVLAALGDQLTIPRATLLVLAVNMLAVGLSEELMFRGVLLAGFLDRYTAWQAVFASSAIFGLMHALNGFTTGDVPDALWQSGGAFLQGVGYAAVRLRTRSIWPMAVVHGLWDFSLMLQLVSGAQQETAPLRPYVSLLLVMPIFLYGLYLLWDGRGEAPHGATAGGTP
ncbi:CPBP family intramembrane glutamic endopeptidase [Pseudoduganella dura]|nr:CPBP family intramembrane glutamic endopeptidase [Pseudoduganella dura]GGX78711.1 CPBP family intramembrane metalloprotease [Pseudoduganella dura]